MSQWRRTVKLKHLFTEEEDYESVKKSMADIATAIEKEPAFSGFNVSRFRDIPEGDDVISPLKYANVLIGRMYDYADAHGIWIE